MWDPTPDTREVSCCYLFLADQGPMDETDACLSKATTPGIANPTVIFKRKQMEHRRFKRLASTTQLIRNLKNTPSRKLAISVCVHSQNSRVTNSSSCEDKSNTELKVNTGKEVLIGPHPSTVNSEVSEASNCICYIDCHDIKTGTCIESTDRQKERSSILDIAPETSDSQAENSDMVETAEPCQMGVQDMFHAGDPISIPGKVMIRSLYDCSTSRPTMPPYEVEGASVGPNMNTCKCPPAGKCLARGRRQEMEDTVAVVPFLMKNNCNLMKDDLHNGDKLKLDVDLHFFAVYDGHGGSQASKYCKDKLHHILLDELISLCDNESVSLHSKWEKAMTSCFLRMDREVGGVCPNGLCDDLDSSATCCANSIAPENVGTTAIVAIVCSSQIVIANCGDSRAVLSRGGNAILLSTDHKPEREDENNRIEAAGGRVIYWDGYRVGGLLALSRAIGDRYLKRYVIAEPEVRCMDRSPDDEFLILASDGLWDKVKSDVACEIVRRCLLSARKKHPVDKFLPGEDPACSYAASSLVRLAYNRGSKDNISVVVVDLKGHNSHLI